MVSLPPKHFHVREQAGWSRMPYADDLIGLTLTAKRRAKHIQGVTIAGHFETAPEGGRHATVIGIFDHASELPILDQLSPLAAELEFVTRVIDRPGEVGLHVDATLHRCHHVSEAGDSWFKVEIGHAVDGRPVPTGGTGIGNARQSRARLRSDTTQTAQQNAITNQIFATGRLTVIVKRIA